MYIERFNEIYKLRYDYLCENCDDLSAWRRKIEGFNKLFASGDTWEFSLLKEFLNYRGGAMRSAYEVISFMQALDDVATLANLFCEHYNKTSKKNKIKRVRK